MGGYSEVEAKIQEIEEGHNLVKFLLNRFEPGDYRKHLGLISTIGRDFENLSNVAFDNEAERSIPLATIVQDLFLLANHPSNRLVPRFLY